MTDKSLIDNSHKKELGLLLHDWVSKHLPNIKDGKYNLRVSIDINSNDDPKSKNMIFSQMLLVPTINKEL